MERKIETIKVCDVVAHFEGKYAKLENYPRKTVEHLKRREAYFKKLVKEYQSLLDRPGRSISGSPFSDSPLTKAIIEMLDKHRKAILAALETKIGKAA